MYRSQPALYEVDFHHSGFEWIDFHDADHSIVSFIRRAKRKDDYVVVVCNFTPTPHLKYRIGFPEAGAHLELFNSDAEIFGGSNLGNSGRVVAEEIASHGRPASAELVLPPLGVVVFKPERPLAPLEESALERVGEPGYPVQTAP
jgi:1,4-alpha-glucan branching enzyme